MKARRGGQCRLCERPIRQGETIVPWRYGWWVHHACRVAAAETERVRQGETFAGTAPKYRRKIKRD